MRTKERKDQLGEVFTPPELVNEILDKLNYDWTNPNYKILDPTCGNGNFLVEDLKRLLRYHTKEHALTMIYGADIMDDNCQETIKRLYGDGEIVRSIIIPKEMKTDGVIAVYYYNGDLITNIVQADGLLYDYSFDEMPKIYKGKSSLNEIFFN